MNQANDSLFTQAFFSVPLGGVKPVETKREKMLPKPDTMESEDAWFQRAMADATMIRMYPDERDRQGIAKSLWESVHANERQSAVTMVWEEQPNEGTSEGAEKAGSKFANETQANILPTPTADEDEKTFIARCMGSDTMNQEFPDQDQRAAVCYRQWDSDANALPGANGTQKATVEKAFPSSTANEKGNKMTDQERQYRIQELVNEEMQTFAIRQQPVNHRYPRAYWKVTQDHPELFQSNTQQANTQGEDMDKRSAADACYSEAQGSRARAHDAGANAWQTGNSDDHATAQQAHTAAANKFREAAKAHDFDGDGDGENGQPDGDEDDKMIGQLHGMAKEHDALANLHGEHVKKGETK